MLQSPELIHVPPFDCGATDPISENAARTRSAPLQVDAEPSSLAGRVAGEATGLFRKNPADSLSIFVGASTTRDGPASLSPQWGGAIAFHWASTTRQGMQL